MAAWFLFARVSTACRFMFPIKRYSYDISSKLFLGRNLVKRQFGSTASVSCIRTDLGEISDKVHPDDRTVFVGLLNPITTEDSIKCYFSQFGDVERVTVKAPKKYSVGPCAFVLFKHVSSLSPVLSQNHFVDMRKLKVLQLDKKDFRSRKIRVVGVPLELDESQLRSHFSQFGEVMTIEFGFDPQANCRTSYCFVGFTSEDAVIRALQSPEQQIGKYSLEIQKSTAKPKDYVKGKVFIDRIPESTTVDMVKDYFSKFGNLDFVHLIFYRGHDGAKDFAFVGFKEDETIESITRENGQHVIDGKEVIAKRATSYQERADRDLEVFVENIPSMTTEQQTKEYFQAFGEVKNVVIIKRWRSEENLQSGIIRFSKTSAVDRVMAKPAHVIDNGKVTLKKTGWTAEKPKITEQELLSFL